MRNRVPVRHPQLVFRRRPDGRPTVLQRLPHLIVQRRPVRKDVAVREEHVGAQQPRVAPLEDSRALDDVRRDHLDVVRARERDVLLVRLDRALAEQVVREPERDAPVGAQPAAVRHAPLAQLLALPLLRLGLVRELERGEHLGGLRLARGRPDDARAGLDDGVERGVGVRGAERGVVVVEDGRDAVVEGVEAAGEGADADLFGREGALGGPGGLR